MNKKRVTPFIVAITLAVLILSSCGFNEVTGIEKDINLTKQGFSTSETTIGNIGSEYLLFSNQTSQILSLCILTNNVCDTTPDWLNDDTSPYTPIGEYLTINPGKTSIGTGFSSCSQYQDSYKNLHYRGDYDIRITQFPTSRLAVHVSCSNRTGGGG